MTERSFEWPKLNTPEDANATHRWARACLEMWEAERAELLAEAERLRGPGTPHARMEALWHLIHQRDDALAAWANYSPTESKRTSERAFIEAFDALLAEVERLREALRQIVEFGPEVVATLDNHYSDQAVLLGSREIARRALDA